MRMIFEPNSKEARVWYMHHDGKCITEIAEIMKMEYLHVKDIILYGMRMMG